MLSLGMGLIHHASNRAPVNAFHAQRMGRCEPNDD
jgi:hypothetical protein